MDEMFTANYGPMNLVRKEIIRQILGQGTWWEPLYGAKVWSQVNLEANGFAIVPKEPWRSSGFRYLLTTGDTLTVAGSATHTIAESGAISGTLSDPTFLQLNLTPKTIVQGLNPSEIAEFLGKVDDSVDIVPYLRELKGKVHARMLNILVIGEVDTVDSAGFTPLDRIVSSYAEVSGNAYIDANDSDVYGQDRDSAANDSIDAQVSENDGTLRDLTLSVIDNIQDNIWDHDGHPKVILTRNNTLVGWQALLESERRFMDSARVVPTFGGVRGVAPGVEAGFMVATYLGVPIITSIDVPYSDAPNSGGTSGLGKIYFLDTDYLRLRVMKPTTYFETERNVGFAYMDDLTIKGYYETIAEMLCTSLNRQGKVTDIQ